MSQKRYRDSCKGYRVGDDKCRFFCGVEGKDREPWCYNIGPMDIDQEEWERIDAALREFAEKSRAGGGKG